MVQEGERIMTKWNGLELPESFFHDDDVYIACGDSIKELSSLPTKSVRMTSTRC